MARIPSSSQKTMSPAEEVSPPNSTGTSLPPLPVLLMAWVRPQGLDPDRTLTESQPVGDTIVDDEPGPSIADSESGYLIPCQGGSQRVASVDHQY